MSDGEAPKRGKGRRNDIPWDAIRQAYEQEGQTNISELARRFGVKRDTIKKRIDTENWATKGQIAAAARSNVIELAKHRAVQKLGGDAAIEQMAEQIAEETKSALKDIPDLHAQAALLLRNTFARALKLGDPNAKPAEKLVLGVTQGETTAVADLLNAMSKFTRDTRLDAGLKEGAASTEAQVSPQSKQRRISFVTVEKQAEAS